MIIKTITVGPTQKNCYLIGCPETHIGAVIDPGWDAPAILAEIKASGLDIKYVLNTHAHWDHTSANAKVIAATSAKLALHPADLALLQEGGGADMWGVEASTSPDPDLELVPGEILEIGTLKLEIIHTPGHTPGHVSFYEAEAGVVFTGDLLFRRGLGRYDLPGGDRELLAHSVKHGLMALPDNTVVYPGYGSPTTIGEERAAALFEALLTSGSEPGLLSRRRRLIITVGGAGLALLLGFFALLGTRSFSRSVSGSSGSGPTPGFVYRTATPTPTDTPVPPTATETRTPTPVTPTSTPTDTPTPTPTPTASRTPRPTRTPTPTSTATATATDTPTPSPTVVQVPTRTPSPTAPPPPTSPPPTPRPPTATPAPAPTNTPPPPPTNTPPPPPTDTPAPPPTGTPRPTP